MFGRRGFRSLLRRHRKKALRFEAPAQLHSLFMASVAYSESPDELLALLESSGGQRDPRKSQGELFPSFYDSGPKLRELLSALVSRYRPRVIMETGVAHGGSTQVFLDSLDLLSQEAGESGSVLHSVDVEPRTKDVIREGHPRWRWHHLREDNSLEKIFRTVGPIDVFFHDSDHSYRNQMVEYELAWKYLNPGGFLISDDISWSNAFQDFCRKVEVRPLILSESPKVAGFIRKSF